MQGKVWGRSIAFAKNNILSSSYASSTLDCCTKAVACFFTTNLLPFLYIL